MHLPCGTVWTIVQGESVAPKSSQQATGDVLREVGQRTGDQDRQKKTSETQLQKRREMKPNRLLNGVSLSAPLFHMKVEERRDACDVVICQTLKGK